MARKKYPHVERGTVLYRIGFLATVWWAVSGLYVVLLFWYAMDFYTVSHGFTDDWLRALSAAYNKYPMLPVGLSVIVMVWAIMGYIWMRQLNKQKIPYSVALKELFLTIRK